MLFHHDAPSHPPVAADHGSGDHQQQASQACWDPVQDVVQAGGEFPQELMAGIATAGHGIGRIDEPIGPGCGKAAEAT